MGYDMPPAYAISAQMRPSTCVRVCTHYDYEIHSRVTICVPLSWLVATHNALSGGFRRT